MAETLDTRALALAAKRIEEEELRRFPQLKAASDWTDHCKRVGFLDGLAFVKALLGDVERELYGRRSN